MGFFRQQERRWAMQILAWQYKKQNLPLPSESALRQQAENIVQQAHRIAAQRSRNVFGIVKELAGDLIKRDKRTPEDENR